MLLGGSSFSFCFICGVELLVGDVGGGGKSVI